MKTLYEVSRVLTFSFAMLVCGMLIGGACMAQKQKPVKPKTSSEIMKELKDKKQLDTHVVEDPAKAEGPAGAGIVWVGRIVPGSDPPKRSEWATVGEWVVFKIRAVRDPFKAACASMDETMTSVIKRMMKRYVAQVEGRRKPNSSLLRQDLED
jgi:hypothetical protein